MVAGDNLDHGDHRGDEQGEDGAHRERKKTRQLRLSLTIGGEDADEVIGVATMSGRRTRRRPSQRRNASSVTPLPASTPRGDSVTQR